MSEDISVNDNIVNDQEDQDFFPWRIFINHVDTYHGKKLASVSLTLYQIKINLDYLKVYTYTCVMKYITR